MNEENYDIDYLKAVRLSGIIARLREGVSIDAEDESLLNDFRSDSYSRQVVDELLNPDKVTVAAARLAQVDFGTLANKISEKIFAEPPSIVSIDNSGGKIKRLYILLAAAMIAIMAVASYYFVTHPRQIPSGRATTAKMQYDVAPGGNKAILTLADGSTMVLGDSAATSISQPGVSAVMDLRPGILQYKKHIPQRGNTPIYNTITTPRGGQYKLILADGTKVWLNASSTLRFPVFFDGSDRSVEMSGEGYFEVAADPKRPFKVLVDGQVIEALGTNFNIHAYADEGVTYTTLLQGAVRVSAGVGKSLILTPGQQCQSNGTQLQLSKSVDLRQVMAWKDGIFLMNESTITTIMRDVSRWYQVEVEYRHVPTEHFVGSLGRDRPLSELLHLLELTGSVKFTIIGNKVIVE